MAGSSSLAEIMQKAYEDEGLTWEQVIADQGFISTGNVALDYVLGGGVARGRITEFSGLSQTGKTSTACQVAAQCQKMGEPVLYVDFEQALDKPYLRALGVDTEDKELFLPLPASSLEHGMSVASQAIRTGQVGCAIFDSVAAMTPKKIIEEDGESRTTAMERARLLKNELGKLNSYLARTGTAAIFINHEMDVIETSPVRPGMPKRVTTPGGTGLKFYSSQRVRFQITKTVRGERVSLLSGEKISEGHSVMVRATVTKNKLAPPNQFADLYLVLGKGFSDAHASLGVLVAAGIVKKATAGIYHFPEDLYHPQMKSTDKGGSLQGLGNILDFADFDPDWAAQIRARAWGVLAPTAADPTASRVRSEDPEEGGTAPVEQPVEDPDEVVVTAADVRPSAPAPVSSAPKFGPPPGGAFRLTDG